MHIMEADWDDLKTVLALVRGESLAGAASDLGLNYTTVARRIAKVEERLGQKLFERLAGGYQPNELALMVAEHASRMEAHENDLMRRLQGQDQKLSGKLVVTAPQLLIGPHLAPVIDQFCTMHEKVDLLVRATNDLLDLNRREADLAIRISRSPGDTLTGIRLCFQRTASFANKDVARQIDDDPEGVVNWIVYEQTPEVPKAALSKYPNSVVRFRFDDMAAMIGAAQAGLGVIRTPVFLGRATAGLVQVPVLPPQPYADIWVVGHPDVWPGAKAAAFRDILVPYFRARRGEFVA